MREISDRTRKGVIKVKDGIKDGKEKVAEDGLRAPAVGRKKKSKGA